ncbi:Uncharacterised protein [Bordetella pertussis]|nr:Uncharacterised protein [Bordetella pertussis]
MGNCALHDWRLIAWRCPPLNPLRWTVPAQRPCMRRWRTQSATISAITG